MEKSPATILAIETSCDETAVSIVEASGDVTAPTFRVVSEAVHSQIDIHKEYGGVYPALAKREHQNNSIPLLHKVITESGLTTTSTALTQERRTKIEAIFEREPDLCATFLKHIDQLPRPEIDYLAVTYGPGLAPALWVGVNIARALSCAWNIPLIPTNHMAGHVASVLEEKTYETPALALLVSGGHTELDLVPAWGTYTTIGRTRDDAIGEAFDKVARVLELPYPGGPEISKCAHRHREQYPDHSPQWDLPRPMITSDDFDFSFSGIKTAVLYRVRDAGDLSHEQRTELAREFEDAVIDVLVSKTKRALATHPETETLIIAGGVAANRELRARFEALVSEYPDIELALPSPRLATDNATMIAFASYIELLTQEHAFEVAPDLQANSNAHF